MSLNLVQSTTLGILESTVAVNAQTDVLSVGWVHHRYEYPQER